LIDDARLKLDEETEEEQGKDARGHDAIAEPAHAPHAERAEARVKHGAVHRHAQEQARDPAVEPHEILGPVVEQRAAQRAERGTAPDE